MCDDLGISDEKMDVYLLKYDKYDVPIAYTFDDALEIIKNDLENLSIDDFELEYIISKKRISKSEFENLPEYEE